MDEISPSGITLIWEVVNGSVQTWQLAPGRYGLECDDLGGLAGEEPAQNAVRIERLLAGDANEAVRCAALLNAAAALYVSGNGWSLDEAAAEGSGIVLQRSGGPCAGTVATGGA